MVKRWGPALLALLLTGCVADVREEDRRGYIAHRWPDADLVEPLDPHYRLWAVCSPRGQLTILIWPQTLTYLTPQDQLTSIQLKCRPRLPVGAGEPNPPRPTPEPRNTESTWINNF